MAIIRPALIEKFGRAPVVDMYRQAAIRCQKARNWPATATWAERGLAFYGSMPRVSGRGDRLDTVNPRVPARTPLEERLFAVGTAIPGPTPHVAVQVPTSPRAEQAQERGG